MPSLRKTPVDRPVPHRTRFRILGGVTLALLAVLLISWTQKGDLPSRSAIRPELLEEPAQTDTVRAPFEMSYKGKSIQVHPVADYEIAGLVVSHNNIESIADIYHDSTSVDTKDLCVIWGENLRTDDYHDVEFKSGPWTCYFRYRPGTAFHDPSLSNNHMVTDQARLRKLLDDVQIGDQIRFKGTLVNYRVEDWGTFWRTSSLTRYDGGNGACEVVFFDELEVLEAGTPVWYALFRLSLTLLALVPFLFVYLVWLESRRFSGKLGKKIEGPLPEVWGGSPQEPAEG